MFKKCPVDGPRPVFLFCCVYCDVLILKLMRILDFSLNILHWCACYLELCQMAGMSVSVTLGDSVATSRLKVDIWTYVYNIHQSLQNCFNTRLLDDFHGLYNISVFFYTLKQRPKKRYLPNWNLLKIMQISKKF
jgi:hypothetical protein